MLAQLTSVVLLLGAAVRSTAQTRMERIVLKGLNYGTRKGPDWDPDRCKSYKEIREDLDAIERFTTKIRIFSLTDCNQGEMVMQMVYEKGMTVFLGMWVGQGDRDSNVFNSELSRLKQLFVSGTVDWSVVDGVSVGSEAIYRGDVTTALNLEFHGMALAEIRKAGYKFPVTIVDIGDVYKSQQSLFSASDFITVNSFPFWQRKAVQLAVAYLIKKQEKLLSYPAAEYPENKTFSLFETGWASSGSNAVTSRTSPENQARYFQDFYCQVHLGKPTWGYYWFGAINADWRIETAIAIDNDPDTVEGHFGLFFERNASLGRYVPKLKPDIESLRFTCPQTNNEVVYFVGTSPVSAASSQLPPSEPTGNEATM